MLTYHLTGNIGVSVIIAALRRNMDVLAVIRNKSSADKITRNLNPPGEKLPTNNVTMVEADVTSDGDNGVKGIVEKVKKGELPGFQHVYSTGKSEPIVWAKVLSILMVRQLACGITQVRSMKRT